MRALLVHPGFSDTYWSFKYAVRFLRKKALSPPLGLLTVAAMLPRAFLSTSQKFLFSFTWVSLVRKDLSSGNSWVGQSFAAGGTYPWQSASPHTGTSSSSIVLGEILWSGKMNNPLYNNVFKENRISAYLLPQDIKHQTLCCVLMFYNTSKR